MCGIPPICAWFEPLCAWKIIDVRWCGIWPKCAVFGCFGIYLVKYQLLKDFLLDLKKNLTLQKNCEKLWHKNSIKKLPWAFFINFTMGCQGILVVYKNLKFFFAKIFIKSYTSKNSEKLWHKNDIKRAAQGIFCEF